ncbi:MAG: hypothetical protein QXG00_00330 [Candidatus Woesearchaeota archaeon]
MSSKNNKIKTKLYTEKSYTKIYVLFLVMISLIYLFSSILIYVSALIFIPTDVNNSKPTINVTFTERPIININYRLYDEFMDYSDSVVQIDFSENHILNTTKIVYNTTTFLFNGEYNFWISGRDIDTNFAEETAVFNVYTEGYMPMQLIRPLRGVANSYPFDIQLYSSEIATCKFGRKPKHINDLNQLYSILPLRFEPPEESQNHYNHSFNLITQPEDYQVYTAICNRSGHLSPLQFLLGYDTTPSAISVTSTPNPIIDPSRKFTEFTITTSDPTICSIYDGTQRIYINPYHENKTADFVRIHKINISYTVPSSNPFYIVNYNITCMNLAGLYSSIQYTQLLNFSVPLTITVLSPQYSQTSNYQLVVRTNMLASYCSIANITSDMNTEDHLTFTHNFTNILEGRYGVDIFCAYQFGQANLYFPFVIDLTNPGSTTITASSTYCSLNEFSALLESNDTANGSGIDYFNYSISKGNDRIFGWAHSGSGNRVTIHVSLNNNLEVGQIYSWNAFAVDKSGRAGSVASKTFSVIDTMSTTCDTEPPIIRVFTTSYAGYTIFNITCEDYISGCKNYYYFGKSNSSNCTPTQEREYGYEDTLTTTSYICWNASDNNNNYIKDRLRIIVSNQSQNQLNRTNQNQTRENCNVNGVTDIDETDIDCGGFNCPRCSNGKKCLFNEDCISNNCNVSKICEAPRCDDNRVNGNESGIDCGGNCDPCGLGVSCAGLDSNCEPNLICVDNKCVPVRNANIDSDNDGLPDWWEYEYFRCIDCANPNSDSDNDGFSDIKEFLSGTDPLDSNSHPEKEKILPIILLIVGISLLIGGCGYIVYTKFIKSQVPKQTGKPITVQNILGRNPTRITREQDISNLQIIEKRLQQKRNQRKKERSNIFDKFRSDELKNLTSVDDKKSMETKNGTEKLKKSVSPIMDEKNSTNKKELETDEDGYIDITKLAKREEKETGTEVKKEDINEDVFQRLGTIKNLKKQNEKSKIVAVLNHNNDIDHKKELINLKPELDSYKTEKLAEIDKQDKANIYNMTNKEIFDRLAEISGKTKSSIKEVVEKKKVTKKDMMDIFANITERKQVNTDVFKFVLSRLLETNQLSKQTVANILFDLAEKKLLTKKEVSKILSELKILPKQ